MNSDVLTQLRTLQQQVVDRIAELEPFEKELAELRQTAAQFPAQDSAPAEPTRRRAGRAKTTKRAGGQKAAGRARRARAGSRAEEVLKLVNDQPGITVPELGKAIGVDSTGLYRVIRQLEGTGQLKKDGRQLQPTAAATDSAESAS